LCQRAKSAENDHIHWLTASTAVKCVDLRDKADQRGKTSTAIKAEELRGQLKRFYVKQVETGDAHEIDRKSEAELRGVHRAAGEDPGVL
jgi:hypothetical protein